MAKRPRLASVLPALGDDASEFLPDRGLILRHGSSLQLMAQVTAVLQDSQEFGEVDPAADWEKWQSRRPEFSLYYAALIDPARDGDAAILCVLRAVLDGFPEPRPPHRQRMIIDYVTTRMEARNTGLASVIVRFVMDSSRPANTFVLALEESCPYWMEKGFLLDEGKPLNARLNIFSDTHLLRLHSDPSDTGTEEDLELAVAMEVEGEGEEEGEAEEEGEEAAPSGDDGSDAEDQMLQAALISSMPGQPPPPPPAAASTACSDDDDDELKAALAMSMGEAAPPAQSTTAPVAAAGCGGGTEEDDELQAAIALSMAPQ